MKDLSLHKDELGTSNRDLIELFVSGVVLPRKNSRSILLLEDKSGKNVLPVWLAQGEDRIVQDLVTTNRTAGVVHKASHKILSFYEVQVKDCVFTDLVGHYQNVYIALEKSGKTDGVRLRADEVMSFCIFHGARFWCAKELIEKCRDQQMELESTLGHLHSYQINPQGTQKYLI